MRPRHVDATPGWIKRRFAKVEKQIRELSAARRLQAATIGAGGLTVKDGGQLVSRYAADLGGGEAVRVGPNPVVGGSGPGHSLQVQDEIGTVVFTVGRLTPTVDTPGGATRVVASVDTCVIGTPTGTYLQDSTGCYLLHPNGTRITHSTTGSAANCFIDPSDSRIWRSTSSLRYKQDVEDVEVDPATVLKMQGRTWRDKAEVEKDADTETRYVGFIAEELHDLGLGQFVVYDAEGDPEAISYDRLSVALLAVAKDLDARVTALESTNERAADA